MAIIVFNDGTNGGGGGGVMTLSNGLTLVGTNGVLGGLLTADTVIGPSSFQLAIGPVTFKNTEVTSSATPVSPDDLVRLQDLPAAGISNADNGLTLSGSTVQLGGTNPLIQNTGISTGAFEFAISGVGLLGVPDGLFYKDGTFMQIGIVNGSNQALHLAYPTYVSMVWGEGANSSAIQFNNGSMTVLDEINSIGLQLATDLYYPNFTPLTYITKGYADQSYGNSASFKATGIGTSENLITFATPTVNNQYRIQCAINSGTVGATATVSVTWTDTTGNVNTQTLITTTFASGSFTGYANIFVHASTSISIDLNLSSGTFDAVAAVQFVN